SSGVTIVGGGNSAPAATSFGSASGIAPAANPGVSLAGYSPPGVGVNSGNNGLSAVPSRPLRADGAAAPAASSGPLVDPAKAYLNWHLQHEVNTAAGRPFPPPPPLPE